MCSKLNSTSFLAAALAWIGLMRGWWFSLIIWFVKMSCPSMKSKVESGRLSQWKGGKRKRRDARSEGSTPSEDSGRRRERRESRFR